MLMREKKPRNHFQDLCLFLYSHNCRTIGPRIIILVPEDYSTFVTTPLLDPAKEEEKKKGGGGGGNLMKSVSIAKANTLILG